MDTNEYATSRYFLRPRGVGQALATGQRDLLEFQANVHGNHWVTILLDFWATKIFYGDPLQREPDQDLMKTISWWTYHHAGCEFVYQPMEISRQDDGYSCGLLSWNGLAHHLDPDEFPLIDPKNVDNECLKIFLHVANHHNNYQVWSVK
jgi:hypothetical protein